MSNCHLKTCPFAFTDESEYVQNLGCIPTPNEIIGMRITYGKTWACHSDTTKPCKGAIKYLKKAGLPYKVLDNKLIDETSAWDKLCPDVPIKLINEALFD